MINLELQLHSLIHRKWNIFKKMKLLANLFDSRTYMGGIMILVTGSINIPPNTKGIINNNFLLIYINLFVPSRVQVRDFY
jgi:hypothetical protein